MTKYICFIVLLFSLIFAQDNFRKDSYMITLQISQENYSYSLFSNKNKNRDAIEIDVQVDGDFYESIMVGSVLNKHKGCDVRFLGNMKNKYHVKVIDKQIIPVVNIDIDALRAKLKKPVDTTKILFYNDSLGYLFDEDTLEPATDEDTLSSIINEDTVILR